MTNQQLLMLKDRVTTAVHATQPLLVDGRGTFRDTAGREVPATEVLRLITVAHDALSEANQLLADVQPRRSPTKPNTGDGGQS